MWSVEPERLSTNMIPKHGETSPKQDTIESCQKALDKIIDSILAPLACSEAHKLLPEHVQAQVLHGFDHQLSSEIIGFFGFSVCHGLSHFCPKEVSMFVLPSCVASGTVAAFQARLGGMQRVLNGSISVTNTCCTCEFEAWANKGFAECCGHACWQRLSIQHRKSDLTTCLYHVVIKRIPYCVQDQHGFGSATTASLAGGRGRICSVRRDWRRWSVPGLTHWRLDLFYCSLNFWCECDYCDSESGIPSPYYVRVQFANM